MRDRFVYLVETADEGCLAVFGKPGAAIAYARKAYEVSFTSGSVAALAAGCIVQASPKWDEAGDLGLVLTRRVVQR